jgi:membrane associated rhomboid family serine protease
MDDPSGRRPDPPQNPEQPSERTKGLILEPCYRHPDVLTGVHCTRCGRPICPDCMRPAPVGYQCPDDAAEGRRSAPRGRSSLTIGRTGAATRALLIVNIGMFVLELAAGSGGGGTLAGGPSLKTLFDLGAMQPLAIAQGHQYWRLFTAMFLHAGVLHLALNMYGLYLFGTIIESAFGEVRFLAIYFIAGLMASVASFIFTNPQTVAVGASGAIFGLLGAWVAFNFRRRGSSFASANLRWAAMLIGLNLVLGFSIAGIDNFAHLGGLITGGVAGTLAEGVGPRNARTPVQVVGFAAIAFLGVALTVWRVSALSG